MGMNLHSSGGRRRSGRSRHAPDGSINVTPFVDVLLILLVVFMVVSTALPGLNRTSNIVVFVLGANRGAVFLTEPDSLRVLETPLVEGTRSEITQYVLANFAASDNFSYRGESVVPYTEVETWARDLIDSGYRNVKLRFRRQALSAPEIGTGA